MSIIFTYSLSLLLNPLQKGFKNQTVVDVKKLAPPPLKVKKFNKKRPGQ